MASSDWADGIVAQAIGGGGGTGGTAMSSGTGETAQINVGVGGSGGVAGNGGAVIASFNDDSPGNFVHTSGYMAHGVLLQSIGGGGGGGQGGDGSDMADGNLTVGSGVGGSGGTAGTGSTVTIAAGGSWINVVTNGDDAHGLVAQSIGGGGGIGGVVTVTVDGLITTTGAMAHGIIAQSIGGGGGLGGSSTGAFAGSTSGDVGSAYGSSAVTVTTQGAISATGANSTGIFAQSMGANNSGGALGTVAVNVSADVTGGSGDGVGIMVASGNANTVTITNGATVSALSGTAISYTSNGTTTGGSTTDVLVEADNSTVIGDIILANADGRIAGTVTNNSQNSLRDARLYGANVFNNGRLVIGDAGAGDALRITGDLTQSNRGRIDAGIDFSRPRRSDRLRVNGDAALDGVVAISAMTLMANRRANLVRVDGELTGTLAALDTRAVDYDARIVGNSVKVTVADTRFAEAFDSLTGIERSVGGHLDAIFDNRSRQYARLLAQMNDLAEGSNDDGIAYAQALSTLSPGASQAMAAAQVSLSKGRLDGALSCPVGGGKATGSDADGCMWANGGASYTDQSGTNGYDGTVFGFSGGAQFNLDENWIAGIAAGYDHSSYDGNNGTSSVEGDTGFLALALGRRFGGLTLSGAVAGSFGAFDTERQIAVPGFAGTATGDTDLGTLSARVRAAYTMSNAVGYVTPILDIDLVHTRASGYTESGAGIFNLDVDSEAATALVVTPSVEIGTSRALKGGWSVAASAIAGISLSTEDDWSTSASLVAAPVGADAFSTSVPIAEVVGRIGLGVSLANLDAGFDVKAEYNGAFGNDYQSHGGRLRFTKKF